MYAAGSLFRRNCALPAGRGSALGACGRPPGKPLLVPRRAVHTQDQAIIRGKVVAHAAMFTPLYIALAGLGIATVAAYIDAWIKSKKPELSFAPTAFNTAVLSRCPTLHSVYRCTPFLTNGHVETIVVAKTRRPPGVDYRREILLTSDGGAVAIDWEHFDDEGHDLPADAPVLILFPGLTGGSCDSYVQHAVLQARHAGIRAAVFNSRGTADSPVLTPQFYSASFTDDTREVINHVRKRYPASTLFAAGWSLGANILVNYLGQQGSDTPLEAAVSMCNPFDLTISNRHINEGFNRIYNYNLASSLKRIFMKHQLVWRGHRGPAKPHLVPSVNTIREFDEAITVHSFSWDDVDAYYAGSSSAKRIPDVAIPLLCIQAQDDPIAPAEAIPSGAIAANPNCVLAVTPCGGHLGWASGPGAPFGEPWTDGAVFEWLSSVHLELLKRSKQQGRRSNWQGEPDIRLPPSSNDGILNVPAAKQQQQQQQQQPAVVTVSSSSSSSNAWGGSEARGLIRMTGSEAADSQHVPAVADVNSHVLDCVSAIGGRHQQQVVLQQCAAQAPVVSTAGPAADGVAIVRASDSGSCSAGKPLAVAGSAAADTAAPALAADATQDAENQKLLQQQQQLHHQSSCAARAFAQPQQQLDDYEVVQLLASELRWAL